MTKYKLDNNGIPFLSDTEIEEISETAIQYCDPECLKEPRKAPLEQLVKILSEKRDLKIEYADLGYSDEGKQLLGRFRIITNTIYLATFLKDESGYRERFVLSHEIGHHLFHRKIKNHILQDDAITDTTDDMILNKIESQNIRTFIEWQANKFAGAFLIPRKTIQGAVYKKQIDMGIRRYVGNIILTDERSSKRDYFAVIEHLQQIYFVSRTSLEIRLKNLNILFDERSGSSKTTWKKLFH